MRRLFFAALVVAACDDTAPDPVPDAGAPFDCDVHALFAARCLTGCHDVDTRQAGLDLQSPQLEARLYGRKATGRPDYLIIDPDIPEESAIVLKLTAMPPFGVRMPQTGGSLDAEQRACVLQWVNAVVDAGPAELDAGAPDAGPHGDAGMTDAGPVPDAGYFDAGQFWGPVVDATNCVPDGGAWCIAQRVPEPLYAVRGLSDSDIWAVGSRGAAYHYDGNAWTRSDAGVSVTLFDVHPVSATDVWAVGEAATVLHYQSGVWSQVPWSPPLTPLDAGLLPSGAPPRDLGGVWATATEAWIVGGGGTEAHYSSGQLRVTWSLSLNETSGDLLRIWRRNATEWWAAGDYSFANYDGNSWQGYRGAVWRIFGLWGAVNPMTAAPVIVAVGADGVLVSLDYMDTSPYPWQPPRFNPAALELKRDLRSVWLEDATAHGWAVGLDGEIVEVDVPDFYYVRHVTPVGDHLLGVWGTAVNKSWAVGGRVDGVILKSR